MNDSDFYTMWSAWSVLSAVLRVVYMVRYRRGIFYMLGDRIGSGSTLSCGIDWLCVGGGCGVVFVVNWGSTLSSNAHFTLMTGTILWWQCVGVCRTPSSKCRLLLSCSLIYLGCEIDIKMQAVVEKDGEKWYTLRSEPEMVVEKVDRVFKCICTS